MNGFAWRLCLYVSSFVLNLVIAKSLGAAASGKFYLLLNNIAFLVLFTSIGFDSAVAYFNSRKEAGTKILLWFSVAWAFIVTAGIFISYKLAVQFGFIGTHALGAFIIINTGSALLANCTASLLFSSNNNRTPNLIFTLMNAALILLLLVRYNGAATPEHYTKLYLIITAVPAIIFTIYILVTQKDTGTTALSQPMMKQVIAFSIQAFTYSMLYALLLRCDYWLVNYFCNRIELGNYLQATKLTQIILLVPSLASFSLFPMVVSEIHRQNDVQHKLLKLVSIYFYTGLALCIAIFLTGYWLFPLLYGNSFAHLFTIFILLSPGLLALAAAYPLATYFSGKNLIRIKIFSLILSIVILLCADVFLIPAYAAYGAAIGSSIAYSFYFGCLLWQFKKTHRFSIIGLLNIKPLIKENLSFVFNKNKQHEN